MLTDTDLSIIALLRIVSEGPGQEELRVGLKYSLDNRQNYNGSPVLSGERLRAVLQKAVDKEQNETTAPSKKAKKKAGDALRKALASSITEYPPTLVEHALRVSHFEPSVEPKVVLRDESLLQRLLEALGTAEHVVQDITSSHTAKGYIFAKPLQGNSSVAKPREEAISNGNTDSHENLMYEDFHPFRPQQFQDDLDLTILEFDGFNKAVDEFFSSIEAQKLESRLKEREDHAIKKLESAKQQHENRLDGLQQVQDLNVKKAQAIEANLDRVEEAIGAVNGLIAQGMDWVEIARLIEMEQSRHNPVAEMIKLPLKLYENTATLLLAEPEVEDAEDYEGNETDEEVSDSDTEHTKTPLQSTKRGAIANQRLAVDIDLALSPWSNARQYYEQKKTAAVKEQRTLQSSVKALKNTERKIKADLQKGLKQEKQVLRPARKQLWFEKFISFISSDGYLVLGGKDAQQNEILYRRHLKKGDVYVHADLHGAASVIIKNNPANPEAPIPPSTLSQAGSLSVATSSAWDSKAVMSAWWVDSDQVSKTAPTGEFLTTGGFMIRGKKNFLPPAQLLLGFGVMFQISEESKAKHVKHRLRAPDEPATDSGNITLLEHDAKGSRSTAQTDHEDPQQLVVSDDREEISDNEVESTESEEGGSNHSQADNSNPLQPAGSSQTVQTTATDTDSSDQEEEIEDAEERTEGHIEDHGREVADVEKESEVDRTYQEQQNENTEGSINSLQPPNDNDSTKSGIRHLSAKERRLLRKGHTPSEQSQLSANTTDNESQDMKSDAASQHKPPPSTSTPHPPHVRGKHGKRAKIKSKYANQDDTDRALAMRLLGSQASAQKAHDDAAARKARDEETAFQKQRRREQHARAAQAMKEHEEVRRMTLEEGLEVLDDDEKDEMTLLDSIVGTPLPGDELLAAIPVCAPWAALGNYKYRVKLQPGSTKKGKAVKEILHKWCVVDGGDRKRVDEMGEDGEKMWPREVELLRGWKDTEVINVVPVSKVRVMMSGGGAGASGKGGGGQTKGKARGGKGSKKQR